MNHYIISIRPEWVAKILSGEKTIEVRKSAPNPPFKMYIYCTKIKRMNLNDYVLLHRTTSGAIDDWHGKVVAEFVCDKVDIIPPCTEHNGLHYPLKSKPELEELIKKACLTVSDIYDYGIKKINGCYGASSKVVPLHCLHITELKVYDKPRELGEFYLTRECIPADSPFGYSWTWEDRHKRCNATLPRVSWGVPIECHRCKNLFVSREPYKDEKSGCMLFDYDCKTKYHKPITRPPQSYMRCEPL